MNHMKIKPLPFAISVLAFLLTFILPLSFVFAGGDSFTQKDREMLIRLDERLNQIDKRFEQIDKRFEQIDKRFEQIDKRFEELREDMNKRFEQVDKRFEQVDKRFEQMMNFLWILSGIFTSLVLSIIAFAFWDRRTMLREMRNEIEKEGSLQQLVRAMREYAKNNKEFAAILRSFNLL